MGRVVCTFTAGLIGLVVLFDFFLENPALDALGSFLLEGAVVVGAFALLLALVNLLLAHERRIRQRDQGWGMSVVILVSALASLLVGLLAWQTPALAWFYRYLLFPLEASVGALLAFAIVGAALRVWRVGTREGAVLLVVGLLVLLSSLPAEGGPLAALAPVGEWIVAVPTLAAVRGILLGVALGIVATGLRVLLLVDRPYEEDLDTGLGRFDLKQVWSSRATDKEFRR